MRFSLSRKILGLALLNLALIAAVLVVFARWQFGWSLESLLLGPAKDRIVAIANAAARDLDATPYEERAALLASYSRRYDVDFYLVDPRGQSLTGAEVELPPALLERLRSGGARGPRPPPPEGELPGPDDRRGGPGFGPPRAPQPEMTFLTVTGNPRLYWIGVRIPTVGPQGERGIPGVLILRATTVFNSKLFLDWRALLSLAAALTAVVLLCWWPFVHRAACSIRRMDAATGQIARGRFDIHVKHDRRDELGHLGEQINRMAGHLESFVKHQKRFLGDIAHELCAPIARIQFALGILERKIEDGQPAHVDILREEIQEMSGLVNELLMFSKAGMQPGETPLKRVELASVVARAVSHQVPGSGTIEARIDPELAVAAHEPYLLRAISNLLRNALRYAGEAGPITVTAQRQDARVLLTVSDCGPGLPEESLHEVFAPFYRPESARSRETGGAGLGLAIVKSCVEACRGTVVCRNRKPSGLEVTIGLATEAN